MTRTQKRRGLSDLHKITARKFFSRFPSELDRLLEIYRLLEIDVATCNLCLSRNVRLLENHRFQKCHDCGEGRWLTKGTFFKNMKSPTLWLLPIWFANEGVSLNASQAAKLSGSAYSSASDVLKKIDLVKVALSRDYNGEHISSVMFVVVVKKRSRETPARQSPKAEEWTMHEESQAEEQSPAEISESDSAQEQVALAKLSDDERDIHKLLSDEPISLDWIFQNSGKSATIIQASMLELLMSGLTTKLPGERYVRRKPEKPAPSVPLSTPTSPETQIRIDSALHYIEETFGGVSRKYLALYIANYWFHVNWCDSLKEELLFALKKTPVRKQDLMSFVTPRAVRLCYPLQAA